MHEIDVEEIVGIICVFGMPVFITFIACLYAYKNKKDKYHLAEVMIEKGLELPEGFFERKETMDSSVKLLKNGLIFLAIGIGAALLGWVTGSFELVAIASVPGLIGVAYIIVSFVVRKKENEAANAGEAEANDKSEPAI